MIGEWRDHHFRFQRRDVFELRRNPVGALPELHFERGVGLVVIDTVTTRRANLHAEIVTALEASADMAWDSPSSLAAVAYRTAAEGGQTRVEAWPEPLALGAGLPTLPLRLGADLCLPLPLDDSYTAACRSLRISR